ncbi:acyltransferase [Georgenia phoenicis]|uniref:acyltransferase n=1 Tax=unclassified Georgenia TaxID=2626815 RepID=UPI0039B092A4
MGLLKKAWPTLRRDLTFNTLASSVLVPTPARWLLYRALGANVAPSRIQPTVWVGNRNLTIGRGTSVNYRVRFNTAGSITIGARCDIAMDVLFVTQSHELGPAGRRAGRTTARPIVVGDGVWIGARALVLPGVTIGDGCVIAAGAVVSADCAPHGLYAGVPARRVRDLPA